MLKENFFSEVNEAKLKLALSMYDKKGLLNFGYPSHEPFNLEELFKSGDFFLNSDALFCRGGYKNVLEIFKDSAEIFVRPANDSKVVKGKVIHLSDWYEYEQFSDTLFLVSSVKEILSEIRLWVVGGRVVEWAIYRGDSFYDSDVFFEEVNEMLGIKHPYVIDLCRTPEGLKVVELNDLFLSGLYSANPRIIVEALLLDIENRKRQGDGR